jgi:hypothetical protein
MMPITKRQFLLLPLLMVPIQKVLACMMPDTNYKKYNETYPQDILVQGTLDDGLNAKYGDGNWQYDDANFQINPPPRVAESPYAVPFSVSCENSELSEQMNVLTICYQDIIEIIDRGELKRGFRIVEAAKYRFFENAFPSVQMRFNLGDTQEVCMFAVFESTKDKSLRKVVKQANSFATGGRCIFTRYVMAENDAQLHQQLDDFFQRKAIAWRVKKADAYVQKIKQMQEAFKGQNVVYFNPRMHFHVSQKYLTEMGLSSEAETWGKHLDTGSSIPKNKFKFFLFDRGSFPKSAVSSTVDAVDLKMQISSLNDALFSQRDPLKGMGAYWVGDFSYDKDTELEINITQSGAFTRLLVNGVV